MWKNSLKSVESDNNKILYEILLNFFLQRNGTYVLNKPRIWTIQCCVLFNTFHFTRDVFIIVAVGSVVLYFKNPHVLINSGIHKLKHIMGIVFVIHF